MQIVHGVIDFTIARFHDPYILICLKLPIYRNTERFITNIPTKLRKYLWKKLKKFHTQLLHQNRIFEFTFGIDDETGISAMAVVHPKDQFSRKIGYNIVKGRIMRQIGEGRFKYHNRYHPLPEYMEVLA